MAGAPPLPPLGTPAGTRDIPVINGTTATKRTDSMKALALLPILRHTTIRKNRKLLVGPRRTNNEEAWQATQVGTLQNPACLNCKKGNGPFTDCVVAGGHFKEACTNCYYGGTGYRCSFRLDYEKAIAHLQAEDNAAPDIPGMAPANNFGGWIGDLAEVAVGIARAGVGAIVVPPWGVPPAENVPRGGGTMGARRIAPLLVGPPGSGLGGASSAVAPGAAVLVAPYVLGGFGRTRRSREAFANSLDDEALKEQRNRLKFDLVWIRAELDAVENEQEQREAARNAREDEIEDKENDEDEAEEDAHEPPAKRAKRAKKEKKRRSK
ncbi:hypothetical protein NHQ30_003076 [Ciborinia camelliae]|nr:hypothetical protein NHQ30_003076 [Ciborinia camelliae]